MSDQEWVSKIKHFSGSFLIEELNILNHDIKILKIYDSKFEPLKNK